MHIRHWFTVMALLAIGAVSLPTPIPDGDGGAATDSTHITSALQGQNGAAENEEIYPSTDQTHNGLGSGVHRMRRATTQPMRLAGSKRKISDQTIHEGTGPTKREEAITADKSYEGARVAKREEAITADKSYEGAGVAKREEAITADKSYEGAGVAKREEAITADKSYEGAGVAKREEAITADKSYEGLIQAKREEAIAADKSY